MQRFFFLLCLQLVFCSAFSQQAGSSSKATGNTYAVIVGISSYETPGIGRLDYAHRDAEAFAGFLESKAGGAVPHENIRLLVNQQATYAAIYDALYWLMDTCKKDDLVYFYFSGHGDVENNTIYKLGFLLAVNTPRSNYINNAIRIQDLNDIANTLSVQKGTRVILITDACHSGDLAGNSNRGNFLVGDQLRSVKGNEIRITSCGPDQLSNEDEGWGGGRGVFSYYLVKGLEGLADYSKDQAVTLDEIRNYLAAALASDKLMQGKENKQNPVVNGPDKVRLAVVDPASAVMAQQEGEAAAGADQVQAAAPLSSLGLSPQGYLFGLADKQNIEELVNFDDLSTLTKEKIPFSFISGLVAAVSTPAKPDSARISKLVSSLKNNPDILKRFNEKLVELIADRGQQIINLYLAGDEAELERRRYYSSRSNGYDIYPKMFATALKLVSPQSMLYHILEVKMHYFAGVAARLKIPLTDDPAPFLALAMKEQQAAYRLEENAAYIQNELGILYRYKKQNDVALKYYLRATQIAPAWALPWANLAAAYAAKDSLRLATEAIEKARALQPDLPNVYINYGAIHERKNERLFAEEMYRKAIRLNSRHYLPFERLALVCLNTTRYAEANRNFYEADLRKKGYKFLLRDIDAEGVIDQIEVLPPVVPCAFDSTKMKPGDIMAQFYLARYYYFRQEPEKYEYKLRQLIAMDPASPVVYHYLGEELYKAKRWKEAAVMFRHAEQNHLDTAAFRKYCDSLKNLFPHYHTRDNEEAGPIDYRCVYNTFYYSWRMKKETQFLSGAVYENWNHFTEAEQQYAAIIRDDSLEIGAYYKRWKLLEKTGRYYAAEAVIRSYPVKAIVQNELLPFYKRVIAAHPDRGEWYYKAGNFLYELATGNPGSYLRDRKTILPDFGTELYQDNKLYQPQDSVHNTIPGTGEKYLLYNVVKYPRTDGIYFLMKADSLLTEEDKLAEINYKIGDLYMGQELPERADRYYKRSVDFFPADADTRIKLRKVYSVTWQLRNALEQLDTLQSRGEIDFDNQLVLAEYCIANGRFADAKKRLDELAAVHPYVIPEIADLHGRYYMLTKKQLAAIPYYRSCLALRPGDPDATYSVARLYAQAGNKTEAWKWLSAAVEKGFRYYWVLQNDESWTGYRETIKWKEITGRYELIKNY
ncbi:MAG: caspase family protein [Chitinophagaceae bacterium]